MERKSIVPEGLLRGQMSISARWRTLITEDKDFGFSNKRYLA